MPKGVFNRPPIDWLIDDGAFGYGFVTIAFGVYPQIALYNNANDGTFLGVTSWVINYNGLSGSFNFKFFQGTVASFYANGSAFDPSAALPWGQIYAGNVATGGVASGVVWQSGVGALSDSHYGDTPIFIIPPNFSLAVTQGSASGTTMNVSFVWTEVPQP